MESGSSESKPQQWFVSQQATRLALSYLTLQRNLDISKEVPYNPSSKQRVDILVHMIEMSSVHSLDRLVERKFAIEVKGLLDTPKDLQPKRLTIDFPDEVSSNNFILRGMLYPVCYWLFNVRNNMGYFRWILEPIVGVVPPAKAHSKGWQIQLNSALASLGMCYHPTGEVSKLSQEAFGTIISQINIWYNTFDTYLADIFPGQPL